MSPIPRLRSFDGPAFLSYGFRPFFLLGSVFAAAAVLAWLPAFFGEITLPTAFAPRDWHVHEMLYGFVPAVVKRRSTNHCSGERWCRRGQP